MCGPVLVQAGDFADDEVTRSYLRLLSTEKNKVGCRKLCLHPVPATFTLSFGALPVVDVNCAR